MKIGRWWWDWRDWGLSRRDADHANVWIGIFSLRCDVCRHWSLGCGKPGCWFCGLCASCDAKLEEERC